MAPRRGRVRIEAEGLTAWQAEANGKHTYVKIHGDPAALAHTIESLMIQSPQPVKNP
jgi:hypothetical protein